MTSFANPIGDAKRHASAYTRALLDRLGDRNPVEVQEDLVHFVANAVAGMSDSDLRAPEKPGKWSVLQVVQHLADTDLVYGYRVRMILTHDAPAIEGYDQDAWATALRYNDVRLSDALEQLRILRAANLHLLKSLDEAQLDRYGIHSERGRESVRAIISLIAAHDLVHRNQIERIKAAIQASAPAA